MDHAAAPPAQRIFVGIPSYRDAETQWTVEDLFLRAEHPERVTVGICWQLGPGDEASCFARPYPRPRQVSEVRFAASDSRGSTWARAQALALARDEEYVLMIDAHMRFVDGWDRRLIECLLQPPGTKTALTAWLPAYLPPRTLQPAPDGRTWLIAARELTPPEHPSLLRLGPVAVLRDDVPPLALTPFVVGNFVFGRRAMFDEVPFDPHIYMYGQEITLSARLWTHGWDLWQPRDPLLHHYWKPDEVHNADAYKREGGERIARSAARVRHLLGLERSSDAAALVELDRFGLGDARPLDALWMASGVDPRRGTIAEVALQGRWNQSPRRPPPTRPRIFVNIPAYRDAETGPTLRDMFAQAAHPDRVFAGVCWQYVEGVDPPHCADPSPRPGQVREVAVAADRSNGACWARMQAFALWQGEEYVLSIDAHTRFERGWDELLIEMLAQCPSEKPLLSTYPASYALPDERDRNGVLKMAFKEFVVESPGAPPKLMYQTHRILPAALPSRPYPTATVGQGFIFARAGLFNDVPFDPHVYFFGDDLTFAARAWTSGWDFFSPNRPVLFHLWDRNARPGHWSDQPERANRLRQMTERRVAHLVGIEATDDREALDELDRYGLGRARSLAAYQAFSGIDFARRTVSERARRGDFGDAAAAAATRVCAPVLRTEGAIVIDDFLPEAEYEALFDYASRMDYQYINTTGTVRRVWDLSSGFPLRSEKNLFVHAPHATTREGSFHYPSGTPLDRFVDAIQAAIADVGAMVGHPRPDGWHHFSVTSWVYPPNTALSMHDDGAGVYSGAYVYYLNPEWKPHWGGLLIVLDDVANRAIAGRKQSEADGQAFYARKWLHLGGHDELALEHGLGRCIFPKKNRIVFIAPDAYHLVTRVLPEAGDNARMSLAGFFHRRASTPGGR